MSIKGPTDKGSYRVLYIEDDRGIARLIQKVLARQGMAVDIAKDGKEGLEMFRSRPYDVICIDYNIPELSGLDVLNIMKSEGDLPPTIMVTGHGNEEIAVKAMKLGLDEYIVKDTAGRFLDLIPMVIERVAVQRRESREKVLARQALRVVEDKYRVVVENLAQFLVVVQDGEVRFANDKLCRLLDEGDLVGKEFAPFVHPEDRPIVEERPSGEGKSPDGPASLTFRVLDKAGRTRWMEGTGVPVRWDAKPATMYSFIDVTGKREAEERLTESQKRLGFIIDSVRDIIFVLDQFGNYKFLNKAQDEYFTYTRDELMGTNFWRLVTADSLKKAVEYLPRLMAGQEIGPTELDIVDKDGTTATIQFLVRPVYKDGVVDEYVGVTRVVGMRRVTAEE